jgi:DNA-directed RNA polymerase specialized sigma24 family protein
MPELPSNEIRESDSRVLESFAHAFHAAYSVLRSRADAEDITQDALLKAHQSLSQLRRPDRVHSWVARIA